MDAEIETLKRGIAACRICRDNPQGIGLPHEPRPVAVLSKTARLAICGQAPGSRVHASGVPFTDPSGNRLRDWMGVSEEVFYDPSRIAIVPMGFCFPGLDDKGGDLPPRRECAKNWRQSVFKAMPQIELILAIGIYAQKWHLHGLAHRNLGDTVADWRAILKTSGAPSIFPLPHPSWRNNSWIAKRPWFADELLPELRKRVMKLV
jgi:uracil-DNA glycosylase